MWALGRASRQSAGQLACQPSRRLVAADLCQRNSIPFEFELELELEALNGRSLWYLVMAAGDCLQAGLFA